MGGGGEGGKCTVSTVSSLESAKCVCEQTPSITSIYINTQILSTYMSCLKKKI